MAGQLAERAADGAERGETGDGGESKAETAGEQPVETTDEPAEEATASEAAKKEES